MDLRAALVRRIARLFHPGQKPQNSSLFLTFLPRNLNRDGRKLVQSL